MNNFTKIVLFVLFTLIQFGCTCVNKTTSVKTGAIAGITKDVNNIDLEFISNILVVNTSLGCSTGENEKFLLLDIPVGVYEIRASSSNYHKSVFKNVRIAADSVTILRFDMTPNIFPVMLTPRIWEEKTKEMYNLNSYIIRGYLFNLKWQQK